MEERVHHADSVVSLGQDIAGSITGDGGDRSQRPCHAWEVCACTIIQPPYHLYSSDTVSPLLSC